MIITRQKDLNKIIENLKDKKNLFLVGCAACATKCATGGEEQLKMMTAELTSQQKTIVGAVVLDTPCDMRIVRKELVDNQKVSDAEVLILLSCGAGVQAISHILPDKYLVPALDTLFLGTIERLGNFHQYCSLCGDCVLEDTAGICPITRCAKSLLNGPCGGAVNGKCEINSENDCAWMLIYKKYQDSLKKYRQPKNNYKKPQEIKKR